MAEIMDDLIEAVILFFFLPALAGAVAYYIADDNSSAIGIVVAGLVELIIVMSYVRGLWKKASRKGKK